MELGICHDCGAVEGQYHQFGCDMERCPFCGRQLISCDCCYKLLSIDVSEGTWAYSNGLTNEQEEEFIKMCEEEGRIPWVQEPVLCALCGEVFPQMFSIPDEEWEKYVIPPLQKELLCHPCYAEQKKLFPYGWRSAQEHPKGKVWGE